MTNKKGIDRLLTAEEVSTLLHIPKSTLYKLCTGGEIPVARIGKHWRFDRSRVEQWLVEQFEIQETENIKKSSDDSDEQLNLYPLADK
ncbi:hypothetical protein MNBD_GAMMA09-3312 [hydrothermal vent metagenome]|uniref:Helix-turn-helix domain-containing protein n=1 Tax=hydrothermal vent metagenome TaxID=652676 RepID=A0A3B0YBU3_9ZZZZ